MDGKIERAFLVRDCSANWFEHVAGCLEEGAGRFYAKNPGWFATDLEGMIDWCAAERVGALAVEGFLSDRHDPYRSKAQGLDAARRVCGYAKKKGVALWLVTPRRADGLVFRELYDQPEAFDLLSPERIRAELPDLAGIAYENEPIDGGEMKAVWTPEGVTFGWRCDEHAIEHFQDKNAKMSFRNETFDMFLDPSGDGMDSVCQLVIDARGTIATLRDEFSPPWSAEGFKMAWHVDKQKREWSCELYIPYTALKHFKGAQFPTTSANGVVWIGNVTRWRVGDSALPKDQKPADANWEASRIWTRSNWWNKDPTAFGKFVFVE